MQNCIDNDTSTWQSSCENCDRWYAQPCGSNVKIDEDEQSHAKLRQNFYQKDYRWYERPCEFIAKIGEDDQF